MKSQNNNNNNKSNNNNNKLPGQRCITSTFKPTSNNSTRFNNSQGEAKIKIAKTGTNVSLSDFLNRKLHRSSVLPNSLKGKQNPVLAIVSHGDVTESNKVKEDPKERVEADDFPLEFVLEEFKCTGKVDSPSLYVNEEVGSSSMNGINESRKRKTLPSLVIIGDSPRTPHLKSQPENPNQKIMVNKKQRQAFNHYGSGKGWWDGNMEGIDNEEVGSVETWEGIGSSTVGGLKWQ